jgi:hypothetical protein
MSEGRDPEVLDTKSSGYATLTNAKYSFDCGDDISRFLPETF